VRLARALSSDECLSTISSLHIGQTIRELAVAAAAATFSCACSAMAVLMSSPSFEDFEVETSDASDSELAEGDSRSGGRKWS